MSSATLQNTRSKQKSTIVLYTSNKQIKSKFTKQFHS